MLVAHTVQAQANDEPARIDARPEQSISAYFYWLEDAGTRASLADVSTGELAGAFRPNSGKNLNNDFGITDSAIWLRVRLQPGREAPRNWLLEIANPLLDRADLFVENATGGYSHQFGGDAIPRVAGHVSHRNLVFPVTLKSQGTTIVYLRIASRGTVSAPASLWQGAALWAHDQATYASLSLYFGLTGALVLYNLMLYLSTRERAYFFYVGFIVAMGFYQATLAGIGAQYLWPGSLFWNARSPPVFVSLIAALALLFARDFLETRARMPRLEVLMRIQVIGWFGVLAFALMSPAEVPVRAATMGAGATIATMLVAGVFGARAGLHEARIFLVAWAALFVGAAVLVLYINGLAPSRPFTVYALLIGSAVEMLLLSLALANRINTTRAEREQAQRVRLLEQERAELLGQSQQRYRRIIDRIGEGVMVVQGGKLVFANESVARILPAGGPERLGGDPLECYAPAARSAVAAALRETAAGGAPPRLSLAVLDGGGQERRLEIAFARVPWIGGDGVLAVLHDITARQFAEDNAHKALDSLRELDSLRSRFVAVTSHEFRTPLATILSSQELLALYRNRMPDAEQREQLEKIGQGVRRMTAMLVRTLESAEPGENHAGFHPARVDIPALCEALVTEARLQQPGGSCLLDLSCSGDLNGFWCDERLFRHIFGNLLSNALKYSPEGGQVRFTARREGEGAVFEVTDQGIGIPAQDLAHLYEAFHRAGNVGDIPGTGLGMSIVRQSIDLHGGRIEVSSEVGQGTRFVVTLPGVAS